VCNILIVEDEATFRRVIVQNLAKRGHQVREVATVADAVSTVLEAPPDLLLLDLNLPDGSGWDVMRALQSREIAVPVIVLSGGVIQPSLLSEFNPMAHLSKPMSLEELFQLVGRVDQTLETTDLERSPH